MGLSLINVNLLATDALYCACGHYNSLYGGAGEVYQPAVFMSRCFRDLAPGDSVNGGSGSIVEVVHHFNVLAYCDKQSFRRHRFSCLRGEESAQTRIHNNEGGNKKNSYQRHENHAGVENGRAQANESRNGYQPPVAGKRCLYGQCGVLTGRCFEHTGAYHGGRRNKILRRARADGGLCI